MADPKDKIPGIVDPNCPPNTMYMLNLQQQWTAEIDAAMQQAQMSQADFWLVRGPLVETKPPTWRDRVRRKWYRVRGYFRRLWDAVLDRDYDDD